MLQITTAVLSAFLDNVTTVLLIVPVTLAICKTLKVPAYPYLFAEIFASNIGGTATLIGDPPNILIGSQVGLSFNEFVYHLTPVIVIVMIGAGDDDPFPLGQGPARRRPKPRPRDGDEAGRGDQGLAACSSSRSSCSRMVMVAFVLRAAVASRARHHRNVRAPPS